MGSYTQVSRYLGKYAMSDRPPDKQACGRPISAVLETTFLEDEQGFQSSCGCHAINVVKPGRSEAAHHPRKDKDRQTIYSRHHLCTYSLLPLLDIRYLHRGKHSTSLVLLECHEGEGYL